MRALTLIETTSASGGANLNKLKAANNQASQNTLSVGFVAANVAVNLLTYYLIAAINLDWIKIYLKGANPVLNTLLFSDNMPTFAVADRLSRNVIIDR